MSKKSTPTTNTPSGPTAPCVGKPRKRSNGLVFSLIGLLILIIILATNSPGGCQSKNQAQIILGDWKVTEEIPVKLDSLQQTVIVPTKGQKFSIKWITPTTEGKTMVGWRAHGQFGVDGGDIKNSGWMKPPHQHPDIYEYWRIHFLSFTLDSGEPVEMVVKLWEQERILVQPTPTP